MVPVPVYIADLRMTVPETRHVDAGGEVDVLVAVHVGQHAAVAGLKGHREQPDLAGIALHVLGGPPMHLLGLGAGYHGLDRRHLRQIHMRPIVLIHFLISSL